jgi:two-component system chemotaxis response regulator CheY
MRSSAISSRSRIVVMLDLVMRGMYGLDVLHKIRELDPRAASSSFSADIQTSSQDLAGEAGAAAFINKPFDKSDILSALDTALAGAS